MSGPGVKTTEGEVKPPEEVKPDGADGGRRRRSRRGGKNHRTRSRRGGLPVVKSGGKRKGARGRSAKRSRRH